MSMSKSNLRGAAWVVACVVLSFAGVATAEDRSADQILADIKAVQTPARPTDLNDQAAVQAYSTAFRAATEKKAELIGELFKVNPEHPEIPGFLPIRWQSLRNRPAMMNTLKSEADIVIARCHDKKLLAEAYYTKAMTTILTADSTAKTDELLADYQVFAQKYPKDLRVPSVLFAAANRLEDLTEKEALFKRIETEFPNTTAAKQVVSARARAIADKKKLERVGKPFELEFTDAITGSPVTMTGLKGKVVVIDFWATWCGPCIAEIPNMKKIYAEYKDKGVEFIGVSLDQPKEMGGLDKLKDYVAKNQIEWPQYYQGNYWKSEFSSSWDINAIPCVFLVDADGNLASIEARGKLETLIPKYLEKAKAKKTVTNP